MSTLPPGPDTACSPTTVQVSATARIPRQVSDCTVPYDDQSGCGVNVELAGRPSSPFVGITFMTISGPCEPHDLTMPQAQQLRAALDAVTRTAPVASTGHRRDEPRYQIAGMRPAPAGQSAA